MQNNFPSTDRWKAGLGSPPGSEKHWIHLELEWIGMMFEVQICQSISPNDSWSKTIWTYPAWISNSLIGWHWLPTSQDIPSHLHPFTHPSQEATIRGSDLSLIPFSRDFERDSAFPEALNPELVANCWWSRSYLLQCRLMMYDCSIPIP